MNDDQIAEDIIQQIQNLSDMNPDKQGTVERLRKIRTELNYWIEEVSQ